MHLSKIQGGISYFKVRREHDCERDKWHDALRQVLVKQANFSGVHRKTDRLENNLCNYPCLDTLGRSASTL